ncbi:MAG: beta-ACP synthase [Rhodospirillaceae bacterium]|nr:beta-ACP synthase [Rhodospirillaceae bacterium]|tara:strand:- start:685 stop:1902 length:1218 start_codon:yes stop_codon:yes gene_type:complete
MNRVVITGLGVFSGAGKSTQEFWQTVSNGRCVIGPLETIPTDDLLVTIGVEIKDFDPKEHFPKKQLGLLDRFSQLGLMAAREAIADSGLSFEGEDGDNTATIIGCGVGGQETIDQAYYHIYKEGRRGVHPFTIPRLMLNAACSHITMEHGITGPAYAIASACSSANHAIGQAFHMVRSGLVERAITGGTEACIALGTMRGWEAIRVMTRDTCRPFSKNRTGMTLGEGASIMTLETLEHAKARGAKIYAEIVGFGMTSDAMDITMPSFEGASKAMRFALKDGGLNPTDIDYINAHGTGTAANDVTETKSIKLALGDDHARKVSVSASKSMFGHALGAAGAMELAVTTLAINNGVAPPTANYEEPDPDCDLDYIPNEARDMEINAAISNSFAFGGLNAVLAIKKFNG